MKTLKPKDYERLNALLYRIGTLRRCDVKFQPDHIEALKRVVKILKPKAEPLRPDDLPPNFGKL